jgi:copper transporter 1
VLSLEALRRFQREFDSYLKSRTEFLEDVEYAMPEEMEEKLLDKGPGDGALQNKGKEKTTVVVLQQVLRGMIQGAQFSVSYCIMLLFMYSNGKEPIS